MGLSISAVFHLLFLLLYPVLVARITPSPGAPSAEGPTTEPQGIEVVSIEEVADEEISAVEEPVEPEEEAEPEPAPTEPAPQPAAPGETADEGDPRPVAERLRVPEEGDPRIWAPVDPELTDLTEEERARIRIYTRFEALNDSLLTEEERARRAMDWTYTDDEGRRWGVSPGELHLGDITIPFPFNFSAPPSARDAQAAWRWDDAERGARTSIVRDVWKERIEAIRERRDRERADTSDVRP